MALDDNEPDLAVSTAWPSDDVVVASVRGEADIGTAQLLDEILGRLVGRANDVVVDLTAVRFFDLTTIRVLISLQRSVEQAGHACVVVMDAWGRRVVTLAGLGDELVVAATVAEAVSAVSRGVRSGASRSAGPA